MDITISNLMKIAHKYGVSAEELMFAEAPHMKSYFVTRKGQGMSVERTKAYKYQSLVSGFVNHKADVFIVTVEPKPGARTIYKNTHAGQEFNMVLEGKNGTLYRRKDHHPGRGRQHLFRLHQAARHAGCG